MQTDNNEGKWKTMNMEAWIGPILCSLQTIIPTVIVVCFGANVVELILEVIPEWVTNGLSIAAGMLPVVGIGMLMRYMPVKKFLPFILVGFVLSAYLGVPVLGIAIIGFAAAFWYFTTEINKADPISPPNSNAGWAAHCLPTGKAFPPPPSPVLTRTSRRSPHVSPTATS